MKADESDQPNAASPTGESTSDNLTTGPGVPQEQEQVLAMKQMKNQEQNEASDGQSHIQPAYSSPENNVRHHGTKNTQASPSAYPAQRAQDMKLYPPAKSRISWIHVLQGISMASMIAVSGFWTSLLQLLSTLFYKFLLRDTNKARLAVRYLGKLFLSLAPYLITRWNPGIRIIYHADDAAKESIEQQQQHGPNLLVLSNHQGDIDWIVGLTLSSRFGPPLPGSLKATVKKSLKYVPVLGWIFVMLEFIFLHRNWASDKELLRKMAKELQDYPKPFWMGLWPEGTRKSPEKIQECRVYCEKNNLPVLDHVLFPRMKAFTTLCSLLPVDGVLDTTVMFEPDQQVRIRQMLMRQVQGEIHIFMNKYNIADVRLEMSERQGSETGMELEQARDKHLEQWLTQRWVAKNDLIRQIRQDPSLLSRGVSGYHVLSERDNQLAVDECSKSVSLLLAITLVLSCMFSCVLVVVPIVRYTTMAVSGLLAVGFAISVFFSLWGGKLKQH